MKIEQRTEMSDWMLIGIWDTRAEAEGWEDAALLLGLYAKTVPVSAFSYRRIVKP